MAVFGSFIIQHLAGIPINHAGMGAASAISHFGLFAAVQGGMFGKAMKNDGIMPVKPVYWLTAIGLVGSILFLIVL